MAAALLERSILARRLHNGPLQDIAAGMLKLQIDADRADQASRPALDHAIAILIEQQRAVRHMVGEMLDGASDLPIALLLEALATQQRASGRKLTWKVIPADAKLPAASDLKFRLKILEELHFLGPESETASLLVDLRDSGELHVALAGTGTRTVEFSIGNVELPT